MSRIIKFIRIFSIILVLSSMNLAVPPVAANTEDAADEVSVEVESEQSDKVEDQEDSIQAETTAATIDTPKVGNIDQMKKMASNESLELYFDETTAEFAIKDKKSGKAWYSNPTDRASDSIAAAENKSILNAQLLVSYFSGGQTIRLDTYKDSVMKEQFEFETIENGLKITYTLGDASKGIELIPQYISKERFQTMILDKLEDDKARKDMEKRFKYIKEDDVYERRDAAFSKIHLERALKTFEEIGYTEAEVAKDNAEHGVEAGEDQGHPFFIIPFVIQLDGDQVKVQVKGSEIDFNPSYEISTIQILPFFGAANQDVDGYIFVPDGSGALIDLNNGKHNYPAFLGKVYGKDEAIYKRMDDTVNETIRLPVFGMKQGNHAFLGVIEDGDSIASIEADVSGRLNTYNSVSSIFTVKNTGDIILSGGERTSTINMVQTGEFKEDITIKYVFLNDENADYVGMAKYYQQYLIDTYQLEALEGGEDTPFYLDVTGSIWKRKTFLGVPYKSLVPLTTFEEAEMIINELVEANINNVSVRYLGWFNKGVNHHIPSTIKIDRNLGGEKGFKEFSEFLSQNDIDFYPDVAFTNVYQDTIGFNPTKDASRYLTKKVAEVYPINPATFRRDIENSTPYYLLSPSKLPESVVDFSKEYKKYNIEGLSLRDLGDKVHSDFNEKDVINREQSKNIAEEQISQLSKEFPDILTMGGNAYAIPYSKSILEAPQTSSGYLITDRSVPFYQMVVHGFIDYADRPINLSDDQNMKNQILRALETGSNVYFSMFYENPSVAKDSEFNYLLSANYKLWKDEAIQIYNEVNTVLKNVRNKPITAHKEIAVGVYETTYGNDYSVIVNYNHQNFTIDNMTIEAQSYKVRQGE